MISARAAFARLGRALVSIIPTRRLVIIVALLSPLWLVSEPVAAYALAMVAAAVILDLLLLPAKWQVAAQRSEAASLAAATDRANARIAQTVLNREQSQMTHSGE